MRLRCHNPAMTTRWKPSVTVAAVIEHDGRYLLIEEHTQEGLRLNNPAGHLDPGESLIEACARECLEETAHPFQPKALVGVYQSRFHRAAKNGRPAEEISLTEIANAMRDISRVAGGVRYEQLVKETSRVFGIQKLSSKALARFEDALNWGIKHSRLVASGEYITAAS